MRFVSLTYGALKEKNFTVLEYLFSTNFGSTYRYRNHYQKRHYLYVIVTSSESIVDNTVDAIRCRQRSRLCNNNQPTHMLTYLLFMQM